MLCFRFFLFVNSNGKKTRIWWQKLANRNFWSIMLWQQKFLTVNGLLSDELGSGESSQLAKRIGYEKPNFE